jgi:hypothetical protein
MSVRNLFNVKTIAAAVVIIAIIITAMIAMSTKSKLPSSEIEKAARAHEYLFIIYLLFLVATVILTLLVWRAGNKYQDTVKLDADAKIETAKATAETAKAEIKKADEKIAALTAQAESLKTEAVKAKEGIAVAQAQAAEANEKAETERLARVRLEASLAPRHLSAEHRMRLIEQLKANPGNILIWCLASNVESCGFAKQIADILTSSGWSVEVIRDAVVMGSGSPPRGLFIEVKSEKAIPVRAVKLQEALSQIGFPVLWEIKSAYSQDTVELMVGTKP